MAGHVGLVMLVTILVRSSRQWIFGSGAEGKEHFGDDI